MNLKRVLTAILALTLVLSVLSSCGVDSLTETTTVPAEDNGVGLENPGEPVEQKAADLGTSWENFRFEIFGEVYQLPMKYSDFAAKGWTPGSNADISTIKAKSYDYDDFYKNNIKLKVYISNFDISAKDYKECYVTQITYENSDGNTTDFALPGNIKVGSSINTEVENAYGTNHSKDDYSNSYHFDYYTYKEGNKNYDENLHLTFNSSNNILFGVSLKCETVPSDFGSSQANSAPFYNYVKPTAQSTNINDAVFSYDGALYKLPCPLSEFLNNGWTIDGHSGDDVISGNSSQHIYLLYKSDYSSSKPNFSYFLSVNVYNTSSEANILKNCLVAEMDFSTGYGNAPQLLAQRIGFAFPVATTTDIANSGIAFDHKSETKSNGTVDTYSYKDENAGVTVEATYLNGNLKEFTVGKDKY